MNTWKLLLVLMLANFLGPVKSVRAESLALAPIVYTGYLHNPKTDKDFLFRFYLQKSLRPATNKVYMTAIVVIYFGNLDSAEYIDGYYDTVSFNEAKGELFLQPTDDTRARRVPVIKMQADKEGNVLTGTVTSTTQGLMGTLNLQNGWTPPKVDKPVKLNQPLSGIYDATCEANDSSALQVETVNIQQTRILTDRLNTEGAFNVINYVGDGICQYGQATNCVQFQNGFYDFINNKATFYQGGWIWQCNRTDDEQLKCVSPRYPKCTLDRRVAPEPHIQIKVPTLSYGTVYTQLSQINGDNTPCDKRQGEYVGTITYQFSNRQQAMRLNVSTFTNDEGKCLASGSAQLYFADGGKNLDSMTFLLPQIQIAADNPDQTFYSIFNTGIVIQTTQVSDDKIVGIWYSKLRGLIGNFEASKDKTVPTIAAANAVLGLGGNYRYVKNAMQTLQITTIESGVDRYSHDPYAGMDVIGNFDQVIDMGGLGIHSRDSVQMVSYDYFLNSLVIRTGGLFYYGWVDGMGLHLNRFGRNYLSVSQGFDVNYLYKRVP